MIINFLDTVLVVTYFLLLFLSIFWLLVLFSKEEKVKSELKNFLFFSAIVPAYNEEKCIEKTLNSLISLDYPKDHMEIVVVNDGSKDRTKNIVEDFIKKNPQDNIRLINQENHGKGNAMNQGLKMIKGEYFACLDADSFVSPDALKVILPLFDEGEDVAAVCPLLKVKKPENILQKVQWFEYIINMYHRFLNGKLHCIHVTPGPFSVYRTKIIRNLGGYDEKTITEDLEIAIRLQKYNYKILQTFDTVVETISPQSWKALFRQRVRWYKGSVDNTINYRSLLFNKKYGDFGMIRMPTVIASGIIGIVLTIALLQSLGQKTVEYLSFLSEIHFDIFTLIKNHQFHLNLLGLPFFKITIAATIMLLSFFIMYHSFKLVREKITHYGRTWTAMITYLLIYSLFLTTVWIYIAYMFVRKKRNFWH